MQRVKYWASCLICLVIGLGGTHWLVKEVRASGIVQTAYNRIQNAGSNLTQRTTLNCSTGTACADVAGVTTLTATGSGGTVTSVATGCFLSGGTITTTGTILASYGERTVAGNSDTILTGDCGSVIEYTDTAAVAISLAQAGSAGFSKGWFVSLTCLSTAPTGCQVTPTTSTINGKATLSLTATQGATLISDGANYAALIGTLVSASTPTNPLIRSFGAGFDGGGSALSSGKTVYTTVPFACTINAWNITVDAGTATVDIWKIATGTAIPTIANTITAAALPAIASGTAIHSTTLTGWTVAVAANDIVGFNLNTVATATELNIVVQCNATP